MSDISGNSFADWLDVAFGDKKSPPLRDKPFFLLREFRVYPKPPPDLVQLRNPRSGEYVLIDRSTGRIMDHSETKHDGVPFARRGREIWPDREIPA